MTVPDRWRDAVTSLLIGLCCLVVYNANGRAISAGDAIPARYLPFAILGHGTILLDPVAEVTSQGRRLPTDPRRLEGAYWMPPTADGHRVSLYSVVLPVLVSPLYVPAVAYVNHVGWTDATLDHVGRVMEKVVASFIAALSASLLFLLLRRRADARTALLLTVAYAFGTSTWVISSQALWQHGLAQLLIVGVLLCVTGRPTTTTAITAGLLCGLIVGNRPPDAVLAGALGAYALLWAGRHRAPLFAIASLLPIALVLLYNLAVVGALGGGYGLIGDLGFMRNDAWWVSRGIAGLLVSPTRGLLVFSPFFLFLALAWRRLPAGRADRALTIAMAMGVAVQILAYARTDWRAGLSWGPRFLTDLTPMLIWMLVPVVTTLGRRGRAGFVLAVSVAIGIEAVGAFTYTGVTDVALYEFPKEPAKLRPAFDWRNAAFVAAPARGLAPAELWVRMRGAFDQFEVDGQVVDTVTAGKTVNVKGWALAGGAAPLQVGIGIDGGEPVAVRTFEERPDVRRVVGGAGPAGWSIPLDTTNLPPGDRRLSLFLWASEAGDTHFLGSTTLTVRAPQRELDVAFQTASERIRDHQHASGYWLTAFTTSTRFESPQHELNTYLTSLLVDLLDPVVGARLGHNLERAREHLTAQVEPDGLVRYHGLPDAPGIGTLGCAITPDTDDTALVWRVAPPSDRTPLANALATIAQYRRPDGLYRTWLSPRDGYQCLDPGRDPNPADLTIQMHLLQLLAIEQPSAASALCEAIRRNVAGADGWVYYQRTPLVPILRLADLDRAGCSLALPPARMQAVVPEQALWVSAANLLAQLSRPDGQRPRHEDVADVLHRIAADGFAVVKQHPPLLYHNDLSATVPRYYWSEDVGYALWLRLAAAGAATGP